MCCSASANSPGLYWSIKMRIKLASKWNGPVFMSFAPVSVRNNDRSFFCRRGVNQGNALRSIQTLRSGLTGKMSPAVASAFSSHTSLSSPSNNVRRNLVRLLTGFERWMQRAGGGTPLSGKCTLIRAGIYEGCSSWWMACGSVLSCCHRIELWIYVSHFRSMLNTYLGVYCC